MRQFMLLLLVVASLSYATTKSYDVVPFKNYIGVQTNGRDGVSQYVRNTLDSLTAVSVWIGDAFDTASYNVDIVDSVTPTHILAHKYGVKATQCWAWLNFPLARDAEPVRGRTYKVVVTRPTGAAISFSYDTTNKYRYGCLSVGGTAHDSWDLAARIAI